MIEIESGESLAVGQGVEAGTVPKEGRALVPRKNARSLQAFMNDPRGRAAQINLVEAVRDLKTDAQRKEVLRQALVRVADLRIASESAPRGTKTEMPAQDLRGVMRAILKADGSKDVSGRRVGLVTHQVIENLEASDEEGDRERARVLRQALTLYEQSRVSEEKLAENCTPAEMVALIGSWIGKYNGARKMGKDNYAQRCAMNVDTLIGVILERDEEEQGFAEKVKEEAGEYRGRLGNADPGFVLRAMRGILDEYGEGGCANIAIFYLDHWSKEPRGEGSEGEDEEPEDSLEAARFVERWMREDDY